MQLPKSGPSGAALLSVRFIARCLLCGWRPACIRLMRRGLLDRHPPGRVITARLRWRGNAPMNRAAVVLIATRQVHSSSSSSCCGFFLGCCWSGFCWAWPCCGSRGSRASRCGMFCWLDMAFISLSRLGYRRRRVRPCPLASSPENVGPAMHAAERIEGFSGASALYWRQRRVP